MSSVISRFARVLPVLFALAVVNEQARAGLDTWTSLPAYGAVVQSLAIDPNNTNVIYAGTQGSGVFKSTDGGGTWDHAHGGLEDGDIQALAVDPTDSDRLYAGTSNKGVYRTVDGGDNWESINTNLGNLTVYAIAIDPVTPTTVYAATFGNLFQSTDGGDTWEKLGTPIGTGAGQNLYDSAAYDVKIVPDTPATLFVATHARGVFKYEGGVWASVWTDPRNNPDPIINNVRTLTLDTTGNTVFAGTQGLGMFKSTNGGTDGNAGTNDWPTQVSNASGLTTTVLRVLAMLPGDTNRIYAGASNGFYYSTNGGAAWTESATELNVQAIAIDPGNVSIVYAGTNQGVYKSVDGGASFTAQNDNLVNLKVRGIAIDPTDNARRYLAIYGGGVIASADGGATWNYANTGLVARDAIAIAAGPIDDTTANVIVGLDNNGAYLTTNNATSWTSIDPGLSTKHIGQLVAELSTPGHFFAGTRAGFLSTENAGTSWSVEVDGLAGDDYFEVNALAVDASNPETLWGGVSSRGIFIGTHNPDESITWTPMNDGFSGDFISAIAVDPADSNIVYAGTKGRGMFKTIDQGATWIQSTEGMGEKIVNGLIVDPNDSDVLYASTRDNGVYKSTNAGATWVAINEGMEDRVVNTIALDTSTSPSTLYAGTEGDGLIEIQSTAASPAPALVGGSSGDGGGGGAFWLTLLTALGVLRRRAEFLTR